MTRFHIPSRASQSVRTLLKSLLVLIVFIIGPSRVGLAQETAAPAAVERTFDPGVTLKAPKDATLTAISPIPNILVGWESEKRWGIKRGDAVPFFYARYRVSEDTKTKKGAAKAGTDLYGVYYNDGNGPGKHDGDWVVKPEWSGLFPLTTDQVLVRAAGTETWYVLRITKGSLTRLGDGKIGSSNIIDEEITGRGNLWGDELYYLITQDDGERQTIQLMQWSKFDQQFSLLAPLDNVVPAAVSGESPVKVTLEKDVFVRRYGRDDSVYDFVVEPTSSNPFARQPKKPSTLEVTAPHKQAMFVLDAEKQLYVPVDDAWTPGLMAIEQELHPGFLGYRPVGSGITTGTKANPLEAFPDGFMAAVWQTPQGVRLAPLSGNWRSYMRSIDSWGIPYWDKGPNYFFNYKSPFHAASLEAWAVYSELYPIEIPEEVRNDPEPTLAWYNGLYAVLPDGTVDVLITQVGINNGVYFRANPAALANMEAAREFASTSMTLEGRKGVHAHYLKLISDHQAKLAEAERIKAGTEQAAIFAHREAERQSLQAKKDQVWSMLRAGDYYGALNLASTGDTRFLPEAIVKVMNDGYDHIVTAELAEAGLRWADERQETYCMNRLWKLRPPSNRTLQYGPAYSSPGSAAPAAGDNSQQRIMDAARQSSRDSYNSGYTSSYLCGSAQFCN